MAFNLVAPIGWVNPITPAFASVNCGAIIQTPGTYVSTIGDAVNVPFQTPLSWSGNEWTTDADGLVFTCQVPGIYSVNISQQLTLYNPSESQTPIVNLNMNINDASNIELNQSYTNTIIVPITTGSINVGTSVTNIVNANVGTTLGCTLNSPSGSVSVISGGSGGSYAGFNYNLIASGNYGNIISS